MLKKGDKKVINAWAFYDWANSVYPLVITTAIFPIFYNKVTSVEDVETGKVISDSVTFLGMEFKNTALYSYIIALSFLIVSFISPILSGIADYSGNKKSFLKFFCYLGSISCMSLFFFDPANLEISLIPVLTASVGFWGSLVFYNAYLPEIAEAKDHDRVSAKGFSMGYIGSSLLLIICLALMIKFEMEAKYCFLLVGLWWLGFAHVTYARLPNNVYERKAEGKLFSRGFQELKKVWREIKHTVRLKRYLFAFFAFSMGIQTVMIMASLFGAKEIDWCPGGGCNAEELAGNQEMGLIGSILLIQFIAVGGAYLFSWMSSKLGNLKTLGITLLIWIGLCISAFFVFEPTGFFALAAVVGLVMGGIQSLSRSTYAKFLPETEDHASYFSFYDVTEKIAIVIGMFAFGVIEDATGSMRNSTMALTAFFVIGFILLLLVPAKEKSKQEA
jgi:UMF1 family MFS transporter